MEDARNSEASLLLPDEQGENPAESPWGGGSARTRDFLGASLAFEAAASKLNSLSFETVFQRANP